jgi:hypothetical protein
MTWTEAFLWTVAVEAPIVWWLAPRARRTRAAADSILANLATHPAAWLLIRSVGLPWVLVEALVFVAEALIYRRLTRLSRRDAVLCAGAANVVTALLSFVL